MSERSNRLGAEFEFEERLNALCNDARSCAVFAYTLLTKIVSIQNCQRNVVLVLLRLG